MMAGASLPEAMGASGVAMGWLSRAHCQLVVFKRFHEAVARQEARLRGEKVDGT